MAAKFKKGDKIILIKQINLINGECIPVGSKGTISKDGDKAGGKYFYIVKFEKYPQFPPQIVPEEDMVSLKQEKIDHDFLDSNKEFSEWLEGYVQKRIKIEIIQIGKRGLTEGVSKTKLKKITLLTTSEVDGIESEA